MRKEFIVAMCCLTVGACLVFSIGVCGALRKSEVVKPASVEDTEIDVSDELSDDEFSGDLSGTEEESTEHIRYDEQTGLPIANDIKSGYIDNSRIDIDSTAVIEDTSTDRYETHDINDLPDYVVNNEQFQTILSSPWYSDDFSKIYVDADWDRTRLYIYYSDSILDIYCNVDGTTSAVMWNIDMTEQTARVYP